MTTALDSFDDLVICASLVVCLISEQGGWPYCPSTIRLRLPIGFNVNAQQRERGRMELQGYRKSNPEYTFQPVGSRPEISFPQQFGVGYCCRDWDSQSPAARPCREAKKNAEADEDL